MQLSTGGSEGWNGNKIENDVRASTGRDESMKQSRSRTIAQADAKTLMKLPGRLPYSISLRIDWPSLNHFQLCQCRTP